MENMEVNARIITSMSQGFANTYLLYTACKLEIFDFIEQNINTVLELSKKLNVDGQILSKILRPLVAYDFLEKKDVEYQLTEKGKLLTGSSKNSLKGYVLYCGGICAKSWSMMAEAAKTKQIPYSLAMGAELFAENEKDEGHYFAFNNMMNFISERTSLSDFLCDLQDTNIKRIVDIGGGTGAVITQFLKYFHHATGTILDLEFVKEKALQNLKKNMVIDRCDFVPGDFFKSFSISGDIFILSRVLHDWNDEDSIKILRNIKANMTDNSVLYIIELVIPEEVKRENIDVYMNDLQIWAVCGGTERKLLEYYKLLHSAGLSYIDSKQIHSGESVIEARLDIKIEEGEI
ncbi:Multifunctional cyclase-dehydratase-3-O-methyl transferase TcmN [Clostridiales bacterium CHKCI001]|nr:Multifunctional cyclase-dehydratase-3-O-methyl transferase TcmN [Clostridiales bacterium CHKCI001]